MRSLFFLAQIKVLIFEIRILTIIIIVITSETVEIYPYSVNASAQYTKTVSDDILFHRIVLCVCYVQIRQMIWFFPIPSFPVFQMVTIWFLAGAFVM